MYTSNQFTFFFKSSVNHQDLHSFPTRRSSDLTGTVTVVANPNGGFDVLGSHTYTQAFRKATFGVQVADRKSTRLNSSHTVISYAVFCLKKKRAAPSILSSS